MKKSVFFRSLTLVLVAFLLSACSSDGPRIASAAPDVELRDLDGNTVKLSSLKGKVIVLDFFATWCPPCKQEIPDFIALQRQYAKEGFTMVGVSLSRLEDTRRFAESFGINYPVLIADSYTAKVYGPLRSIPTTYIIDKDFKIAKKYIGYRPKEVFEKDILELLR
jgi:cytochrome c biogenesis protein CcmG/thiol:disulfide interchange protein DsbE